MSPKENDGYSQLFPKISIQIVNLADGVELNAVGQLVKKTSFSATAKACTFS